MNYFLFYWIFFDKIVQYSVTSCTIALNTTKPSQCTKSLAERHHGFGDLNMKNKTKQTTFLNRQISTVFFILLFTSTCLVSNCCSIAQQNHVHMQCQSFGYGNCYPLLLSNQVCAPKSIIPEVQTWTLALSAYNQWCQT
jgi:hypothetical protein